MQNEMLLVWAWPNNLARPLVRQSLYTAQRGAPSPTRKPPEPCQARPYYICTVFLFGFFTCLSGFSGFYLPFSVFYPVSLVLEKNSFWKMLIPKKINYKKI
jgi:hypothetical protein